MTISIDDIKDKKSLEAWLDDRPEAVRQNCAVFIAARSALRVSPSSTIDFQFSDWSRKFDLTSITLFRGLLISSVAAKMPTEDMRRAALATKAASAAEISDSAVVLTVQAAASA